MNKFIRNKIIEINKNINLNKLINKLNLNKDDINNIKELYNIDNNIIINYELLKNILNKLNYIIIEEFNDSIDSIYISLKNKYNISRSSIVSLIGHVDSGKTSILDVIECSNFTSNEIGGITQYIRSFKIKSNNKDIIFIDTPGHESFVNIRKNCIKISDIIILVISVDDLLKNSIINKLINEIKILNLSIKLIVSINKIDKINDINIINNILNNYLYLFKDLDDNYNILYTSSKNKESIIKLIDNIENKSKFINLKFNNSNIPYGIVIESFLDKNMGPVAKIIIKDGLINIGDLLLFNSFFSKLRLIIDEYNIKINSANPSNIIKVFGLSKTPDIGEKIIVINDIKKIKNIILYRNNIKNKENRDVNIYDSVSILNKNNYDYNLNYIIKTNMTGINDAIIYSIDKLSHYNNIKVNIINIETGNIKKNDIYMSLNSKSELLGFNIKIDSYLIKLINKFNIIYKNYYIIYDLLDYIENSIKKLLFKDKNNISGCAYVINIFNINKNNIIGCKLYSGILNKDDKIKIFRDNSLLYDGLISSMKILKNNVIEVKNNMEFGIIINNKNLIAKKGDKILSFKKN